MNLDRIIAVRNSKTVYRDGDCVIKIFDKEYEKSDILNETLNQSRVEETGLNVPKILGVTKMDDKWAIISEYIKGKTLARLMQENPDKFDEYLELFIDLQLKMHDMKVPLLNKLKDKMKRKIEEASLDSASKYELHTRLESMPVHTKLCHGDFSPENIIIRDGDGTPFILDWSHATQGNASADAARTYLLFCLRGNREAADSYLERFSIKSDTAKQYISKWLPIVAASQSVKGRPEERQFLLTWVSIMDCE